MTTFNPARRAFMRLAYLLAPAAAVPTVVGEATAAAPAAVPKAKITRVVPAFDAHPLRVGTRCRIRLNSAAFWHEDMRAHPGNAPTLLDEGPGEDRGHRWDGSIVTITAGPLNPDPDYLSNPPPYYEITAPWVEEMQQRIGRPQQGVAVPRDILEPI